jgi:serine/threonine protein kinase/Tfp pilus assembly protein PilF
MTIAAHTKLGRYEILSQIGAGGMGEVYLAEDIRLHRKVALKILPENIAADKERLLRFEREAQAASALNHPNIITIHEIGEIEDQLFIATEFIEGETLREKIEENDLSVYESVRISEQIAAALSVAHQAHIIHRDIKPENIMIRRDGYVKILDFGLAKLVEKKSEIFDAEAETRAQVNTKAGMIMGTVGYMSPEQARGKDIDERTDVWSLGVCLYEMLSGRQPFTGETTSDTIAAILTKEPLPLDENLPSELQRIVRKTLQKDANKRYQTTKDLLIDLEDVKEELKFQNKLERTSPPNREEAKTQILNATTADVAHTTSSAEYFVNEIKSNKGIFGIGLIFMLLSSIGLGYWFLFNRPSTSQIESIAVLPFVNEGGNADTEYLSDGMTETLISSLSQLPNLLVKARSSVFRYKGKDTDPQQIGKELNVQSVLNGRVVQRGQDLTLYIELVDAATEKVLWSENYNRKQADLISLQSEIARDVSSKLKTRLSGVEEQQVAKTYTANPEAYQLYLKGRYYLHQFSVDSYDKAVEHFNKAIEIDPAYALAYVGLADTYAEASSALLPPAEAMPKARKAAQKALEIDETLAEAHVSMALVIWWHDWNPSGAEREFKRSIELNPNYSLVHLYYGDFLSQQERFDESIAELKRAQELDPLSSDINSMMVRPYFFMRQYDNMLELARKAIEMDQHYSSAHRNLGAAFEQKGMYEEAITEFDKAIELGGRLPYLVAALGRAYAKSGKRGEALKILEELEQPSRRFYASPVRIASIYAALGDKEQAFRWLEKAYQDRTDHLLWLRIDPDVDSLRSDPRFQDLLRRVGLTP